MLNLADGTGRSAAVRQGENRRIEHRAPFRVQSFGSGRLKLKMAPRPASLRARILP